PGDTNGAFDIFVKDTQTGAVTRVSTTAAGAQGDGDSDQPSVSADGRYVAFASRASNLVPGDTNGAFDIFVKDTQTGAVTRVSTTAAGAQGDGDSDQPSVSADGRYVAFASDAPNLVPGDTNGTYDVFVKDTQTGAVTRVSTTAGVQGDGASYTASVSADGRYVAFASDAPNLVPGDTNGGADVFFASITLVDTTAPDTTIGAFPADPTNNPRPAFEFSSPDADVDYYEVSVDGAPFAPLLAGVTTFTAGTLADGEHTFAVRAVDAAGNADPTPESFTFVVDATAPTVAISGPVVVGPGVIQYTVTYADANFSASTLGSVTLNTTGTVTGTVRVSGDVSLSDTGVQRVVTVSGITGVGNLSISVAEGTATDTAGNESPAAGPSAAFGARRRFDMKASTTGKQSPGWDRVMPGTRYTAALGYGWATTGNVGGSTGGRVPAGGDARVLGDYAYGLTPVAFKVFVGAGQSATVTVHTYAAPTQGKQGVRASVAGPGGTTQTLRGNGTVTVSGTAGADGILTVTFSVAPGSSLWIVNALEVTPGAPV
ncbi:Ig-like domain-containing protein, partial [Gemmata sp.]|uniref:Ig-like domain-containing protein n=1 Tax=Gemmata sp. TaxID=1914242 RepID=UPI003F6ED305